MAINGTALSENVILQGFFEPPLDSRFAEVGAGKTLEIRGSDAGGSTSLDLPCPAEVRITSPAPGTRVRPGEVLTVTWSGDVHAHNQEFVMAPNVQFWAVNEFSGRWAEIFGKGAVVPKGQDRIEVTVPEVDAGALAIELDVPGKFVLQKNAEGGENNGICWLSRRVELTVAP
ncbi:hypothetical protein AKJ08_2976 [Vulgatibacter incomptus]|uniref:Uncharacterized protein n=2 Tax=Vulgatibacter incomptus TaxID=1391653 RepID=A0A0K1PHJ7_9BACT|nr:hypothetical protein AKJ08_2976 [Vulgatibacter incomptus]